MSTDPTEGQDVTGPPAGDGRAPGSQPIGNPSPARPAARPGSAPPSGAPEARPSGAPEAQPGRQGVSRAGATWTAVIAGLVVFILLVVFFIQNQDMVQVHFLGLIGPVPLGLALFIAAVAGGVLVAIAGAIRIIQLRAAARRARRSTPPAR
ncbi:LapA family protein [Sinomonas soli]